jgi:hypothetical protein
LHSSAPSTSGNAPSEATRPSPLFPVEHVLPFALWGMSNNLTDILVQQFKKSFELSPLQAQLVQTAVFFGYFSMAIPSALRRFGYKSGILTGLCMFGTGTLFFWACRGDWPLCAVPDGAVHRGLRLGDPGNCGKSIHRALWAP